MRRAIAALALSLPALAAAGVRPVHGGTVRVGVPVAPAAAAPGAAERAVDLLVARARAAALLERDASGRLVPGALAEVPAPEADGRAFRLRLRPGLRAADGRPLGAEDLAAHLTSLLAPGAPHGWVALPIQGAEDVLGGRARALAGLEVRSPDELLVTLSFPLPEFPHLLATSAAALPDAGPFVAVPGAAPAGPLLLAANEHHHEGRPFARTVELRAVDARAAARLLASGELDLVLRPEAAGGRPGPAVPALTVTVAALRADRLGAGAEPLRAAIAAVDRAELARRFVRGPALPLATLWPARAVGSAAAPPRSPPRPLPARLAILCDATAADQRAVAERLQVKLFDRGVRVGVDLAPAARFRERLAAGDYDVALVSLPLLAPEPALAAAQIAWATRGPAAARRALESLAGFPPDPLAAELADRLARELHLVPLVASGWRASLGPALQGLAASADGGIDLGDLWLLGGGAPALVAAGRGGATR